MYISQLIISFIIIAILLFLMRIDKRKRFDDNEKYESKSELKAVFFCLLFGMIYLYIHNRYIESYSNIGINSNLEFMY